MANNRRLRKVRRLRYRKACAFLHYPPRHPKIMRVMLSYWRYHFKVYGSPVSLWGASVPHKRKG